MRSQTNWARGVLLSGLVFVTLGIVVGVLGFVLPRLVGEIAFVGRFFPATGIVLLVLGLVSLAQYAYIRHDPKAGQRMMAQERDERLQWIRARASQRAYRISASLAFLLLMWASFTAEAGLPTLAGDVLWFALTVVVVAPALVYIGSIVYEQNHS